MTDCWVNVMGEGAAHGLHLHPLATISGTYYVAAPPGVAGLKFEDPRLERFMAAPPRLRSARRANRPWVTLPVRTGGLLLFESWLRHEVSARPPRAAARQHQFQLQLVLKLSRHGVRRGAAQRSTSSDWRALAR